MSLLNVKEPSPLWPYIKAIAKFLKVPGTEISLEPLTDLQDDLAQDHHQEQVKALLEAMSTNTAHVVQLLRQHVQREAREEEIKAEAQLLAEWVYLRRTADKFFYADFKGIQESKFVPLPLDEIFVDLKAQPEERDASRLEKERDLHAELARSSDDARRSELADALEAGDRHRATRDAEQAARTPAQMLQSPGPVVLLGGPGSGKTTLVKRLARSCALREEALRERFPGMPWCFPVVIAITHFVDHAGSRGLLEFAEQLMRDRGGEALAARYREHFRAGRVLLLLDGLDEVADIGQRIAAARAVGEAAQGLERNRLLVTSRRVGYAICRLSVPAAHFVLCPLAPGDIASFVRGWYVAFERSQKGAHADLVGARRTAQELIDEIERNPSVASLATNPLMLTIIALIKHRSVELPHRRVELYRIALETLIESWNLARSLAQTRHQRSAGETPRVEQTREVWSHIALWIHTEANREVSRARLHEKLVDVLVNECDKSPFDAEAIAGSYLDTAAETSGLLEARGAGTFAFVHQSFQEYLAGFRLVRPASKAWLRIKERAHDPRWHEVIRLGLGHLSIVVGEKDAAAEVIDGLLNFDDPLEPFLCNALRLALGCLADQIALRQQQVDAIFIATAARLRALGPVPARANLIEALGRIRTPPGPAARERLLDLLSHDTRADWMPRMEAVRLVASSPQLEDSIVKRLGEICASDEDEDVRAWAAWGLWRHGVKSEPVAIAVCRGASHRNTSMHKPPAADFPPTALSLLSHSEPMFCLCAAGALAKWGLQDQALPRVLQLLKDQNSHIRADAARLLSEWPRQEAALLALQGLLEDSEPFVRQAAANALGNWGCHEWAVPCLLELIDDSPSGWSWPASDVLKRWDHQEKALPLWLEHLRNPDAQTRMMTALQLTNSGHLDKALPFLLGVLQEPGGQHRSSAMNIMAHGERQEEVVPLLISLLEDSDPEVRLAAASILDRWGEQPKAFPAICLLLEHPGETAGLNAFEVLQGWRLQPSLLPKLFELIEDSRGGVNSRAASVLAQWGRKEKATDSHRVIETVLRKLSPQSETRALAAFQSSSLGDSSSANALARADLAELIRDRPEDAIGQQRLREILRDLVSDYFGTTA